MNFLSDEQRTQLRVQHKKERDRRICDRIKAVLLYDKGWSCKQISEALLLSEDSIRQHIEDYQNSNKLKPEGGGSVEKLSSNYSEKLKVHLENFTYLYVKDIVAYVQATWGVSYTVAGLRNWLRRNGFTYKKPSLVPGKANEQQQKEWILKYEELKKILPEKETICFMDGVHPTHNVQLAYGWIKKGVRKELPSNCGRARLNLSGIVDMISHKVVIQEDKMLNAESTMRFFQRIEEAYPDKEKIHLFCDNAKYYKNKQVQDYLKRSKIQLHFLPPYSPNLNPIERLWKLMKERVIYNVYYESIDAFRLAVFGFFHLLSNLDVGSIMAQALRRRVRDKFRPVRTPTFTH